MSLITVCGPPRKQTILYFSKQHFSITKENNWPFVFNFNNTRLFKLFLFEKKTCNRPTS